MSAIQASDVSHCSEEDPADAFRRDVLTGLVGSPKWVSSKHLYDKRGSELFDQICELDEYYVTRCELEIMRRNAGAMVERFGGPIRIIEFGSGSSLKTRLLLDQIAAGSVYLPVDVSREHLEESCQTLRIEYPELEITPVCGDFTRPMRIPDNIGTDLPAVVYFPGSTIGNLEHHDALALLKNIANLCGAGGQLLIGIDLRKDASLIHAAYNDRLGVTANFTKNLLSRFNRELGADFNLDDFDYHAHYNENLGRIEASLISRRRQDVRVDGRRIRFDRGEAIRTEYSHKYSIDQFHSLAARAGFLPGSRWLDSRGYFAVLLMHLAG